MLGREQLTRNGAGLQVMRPDSDRSESDGEDGWDDDD